MLSSKLVTYDAICAAIKGRIFVWQFRMNLMGTLTQNLTWYEVNNYQDDGTLVLTPSADNLHNVVDLIEIYAVSWSDDDQFTLERIF